MNAKSTTSANPQGSKTIFESDDRIAQAIRALRGSEHGQDVLKSLKAFLNDSRASGLDIQGSKALVTLVAEYSLGGRRDFVYEL